MSKKETVDKFKKMIIDMHRGVPDYYYRYSFLKETIPEEEIIGYLIKNNVFVKSTENEGSNNENFYFLGVNGINLANSYKIEALTERLERLTCVLIVLTAILAVMTGITILK